MGRNTEIELMYKGCGYDIATRNITSQFCTLFTDSEIGEVLEYWSDLKAYWQKGYGHPVNYQIATLLLQDVFNIHSQYVRGDNTVLKGKFRFAHAETIMPLLSILVCPTLFLSLPLKPRIHLCTTLGLLQRCTAIDGQLDSTATRPATVANQ